MEILDQWLRSFPRCPTWHDVTNALRRMGLQLLANDIEMVYETGKIIEADCNNINQEQSNFMISSLHVGKLPIPVDDNSDIQ